MNTRFPVNTDRRTILTRKYTLIYSLLFFCGSLLSFISISSARAQEPCTPVVYAFRHAEDLKTESNLTPVGRQHADLYPSMEVSFGPAHNYCPVAYVYSTYQTNPGGGAGTNNPYETAQPLAIAACYNFPDVSSQSLAVCNFFPRTALENGEKLYEYLGLKNTEQGTPAAGVSATSTQFHDELISRAKSGLSTAIFWTSQGLDVLGQAIVPGFTKIPGCSTPTLPATDECWESKAPRNAAYVFLYDGSTSAFEAPDNITQYVQCFNVHVKNGTTEGPDVTTTPISYYCGNVDQGNLPPIAKDLTLLQGKICDTDTSKLKSTGPTGYYGVCQ